MALRSELPEQLEAELNLARTGGSAGDGAGGAGQAAGCEDDEIGGSKVGTIQEIEKFGAKLNIEPFANFVFLEHGKIPSGQSWTGIGVAANVSIETAGGGRRKKSGWIKPLTGLAENDRAGKSGIEKWADRISGVTVVGRVVAELRSKRKARLRGDDAG